MGERPMTSTFGMNTESTPVFGNAPDDVECVERAANEHRGTEVTEEHSVAFGHNQSGAGTNQGTHPQLCL